MIYIDPDKMSYGKVYDYVIYLAANAGIWVQTHTIYYRAVEAGEPPRSDASASRKGKGQPTKVSSRRKPDLLWNGETHVYSQSGSEFTGRG